MNRPRRPRWKLALVALVAVAPLAGCGEDEDITQEALSRLRALRDKTCACAAPACAAEVTADDQALQRWVEDNRAKLTAQRTDAFEREWSSLKREVAACSAANASARGT